MWCKVSLSSIDQCVSSAHCFCFSAEVGDYDPRKHPPGYVSEFRLLNNQTKEIENRIHELHIQLKGMSPSQAEFNYLDKVKWHDMYGVDLHPVLVSVGFGTGLFERISDGGLCFAG